MSRTLPALTAALDLDLWRPVRPGLDAQFDVDRFGEWLERLVDAGDSLAARTVAAMDERIVVAGLSRYVRVLDPGIFEPTAQSDDEPADRHEAMREGDSVDEPLECEIGGYVIRARREDAWDAIVALLHALGDEQGACFDAVMQGCRRLSNSRPETDGLDDLLSAPEQHLHDVAMDRERRLSQHGYATPADARAFLQMARHHGRARPGASAVLPGGVNPIVAAYFRATDEQLESPSAAVDSTPAGLVVELLETEGLVAERPPALPGTRDTDPDTARLPHLRRVIAYVRDTNETVYLARGRELAFLANALLAGCSVLSRPFTPQEASEAAACTCNLGLEHASAPDAFLVGNSLVTAFEAGWSILHRDVGLFVADQLIGMLETLRVLDRDTQLGLAALGRTLVRQRAAGTPWLARGAAEVLGELDMTACVAVLGLLDQCPVVPAALTAILDGRATSVSPAAFDFISTAAQLDDIHSFVGGLPDLLSQ